MAKIIINYRPGVVKKIATEFGMSERNIRNIFQGKYADTTNIAAKALHEKIIKTAISNYNCSIVYQ